MKPHLLTTTAVVFICAIAIVILGGRITPRFTAPRFSERKIERKIDWKQDWKTVPKKPF